MADQAEKFKTQTYGHVANMTQVRAFLLREAQMNREAFKLGHRRRTPCVWGAPGIGKTDIVKSLKKEGYVIKHVPLAQFEEMGDLNGIPQERQNEKTQNWETVMCPPAWVPDIKRDGEKVILLLDDFNRADPRIIKGTMQLIQDYAMTAWSLDHADWHIMCTANPEGGLNDVSPLDPAQISRFSHITLHVEGEDGVRAWAQWASEEQVDPRGISFLLMYPAFLFNGSDRVNPRTWTQAFDILKQIPSPGPGMPLTKDQAEMLCLHVEACVDKEAAASFSTFMVKGIMEMIEPEQILDNLESVWSRIEGLWKGKTQRSDCLFAILERLYLYIRAESYQPDPKAAKYTTQAVNFCKLMSSDIPGKDMRWAIVRRLLHNDTDQTSKKIKVLIDLCKQKEPKIAQGLTKMLVEAVAM